MGFNRRHLRVVIGGNLSVAGHERIPSGLRPILERDVEGVDEHARVSHNVGECQNEGVPRRDCRPADWLPIDLGEQAPDAAERGHHELPDVAAQFHEAAQKSLEAGQHETDGIADTG